MDQVTWASALDAFPESVRPALETIVANGGVLRAAEAEAAADALGVPIEALMIRLLPLAQSYAIVPVSSFQVGAVAMGMPKDGGADLYLGANVEFHHQSLSLGVHGEQCATNSAWMHGETGIQKLAISAAPCGYCRQFLYELATAKDLEIVLPSKDDPGYVTQTLLHYLPEAFGPQDLGLEAGWMAIGSGQQLVLQDGAGSPLPDRALEAANRCYAPYTSGFAGCAIQTADGHVYGGRYAENAAYNPSLAPLESAIAFMTMQREPGSRADVVGAALVEKRAKSGRRGITEDVLSSFAPDVELDYHEAVDA